MSTDAATPAPAPVGAGGSGDTERLRVCMFVYNNCSTDARVLKEAASLTAAGHEVQIVAVLDKKTVPEERRGEFDIVRIDRNPPHYRLLRLTRQLRRRLRLGRARVRRFFQRRRNRITRRGRLIRNGWRRSRLGRRMAQRRKRRRTTPLHRSLRLAGRAVGFVVAAPLVVGRAVRWRVLRAAPGLRRPYYRWRARGGLRPGRRSYRRQIERERAAQLGLPPPRDERVVAVLGRPFRAVAYAVRNPGKLGPWLDRTMSRASYRAVMFFHKPLMFTDYYVRAYRRVGEQDFDVFHAHDLNTLIVAWAAARRAKTPFVYDSHELYTEVSTLSGVERRVWRFVERRLAKRATRVLTVCESISGELVERYRVSQPVILLNCPSSSDVPKELDRGTRLRDRADVPDDERIVLYQGGYAPYRGLPELIESARYYEHGVLVLMGWGPIEDELARQIREADLEDRVRMIGPAERHELLDFTCGADVGVIPYQPVGLNNYYTTPNKLFEYIAAGLPVLGSRVPELSRFVEGYGLGVTFDPYDAQDIASAVNHAFSDDRLLAGMREQALVAGKELIWEREEVKLLDVYERDVRPALHQRRR